MKTVLISAYTCCPNRGSEPGNGWNWIMEYIRNGYVVHCVTSPRYIKQIESFCKQNSLERLHFYFTSSKFSSITLQIPALGNYIHYYIWLLNAIPIVRRLNKEISFKHAHHVTYSSVKFGTPLYGLTNTRVILGPLGGGCLPHSSLKKYLGKNYYFEFLKFSFGNFLSIINPTVSLSVKKADVILISNEIAANIIKKYSSIDPIKMFDAGLSDYFENDFIKRDINGVINILWIGRMLPRKGLNLAIETIVHLPPDFNFHFYIVGDGDLLETAKKEVLHYNLQNKVTFMGKLPHHELKPVFEKSHLLLFPSLIDSCPMQIFESMAFSLPIVTLNHQGMKDQVNENTGVKINISSKSDYPKLLSDGILSIVKDAETYNKLSLHAHEFGQKQLWNKRIKKFLQEL